MLWPWLALMTAFAAASQDAWIKRHFSHMGLRAMAAYPMAYGFPFYALALVFIPVPALDRVFLSCYLVSLPLNMIAFLIYLNAIRTSALSLTVPYLAFTPAFMIATGKIFLGELPNIWGAVGIGITCIGGYVLNIDPKDRRLLTPLRAFAAEPGARQMLFVAFLFSFAAVIGKKGILHSSPLFFTLSFFSGFSLLLAVGLCWAGRVPLRRLAEHPVNGAVAGLLFFAHGVLHAYAIAMAKAAYMIAIKRLSVLFGVLFGGIWFGEARIGIRLAGAALMVSGAVVILLFGS
ncbi:MAG: EamA family transporter [Desulfobacterales bacterium]|jgi:drug/metabolite transporter (DMT)-like permease